MDHSDVEIAVEARFSIGESPVWDAENDRLFWCAIDEGEIHALTIATGRREVWSFGAKVGSFGLCESGRLVVALTAEVILFDTATGARDAIAAIPHAHDAMRLNDGKVGPDGAFYVGSMDLRPIDQPMGRLYRVAPDGAVTVCVEGLRVSNGLAWSPDGRIMYHSDSRGPWVDRWAFDPATGALGARARFLDLDDKIGRPDGAACDMDGFYWSAGVSAGRLNRFAPDGRLSSSIALPTLRPTMPCFAGPDLRTLYVTSLTENVPPELLEKHPLCGSIVRIEVETPGVPVHRFRA